MSMLPLQPAILLNLVQLERSFRRILDHLLRLFHLLLQALKSGNPGKYRAALVALREMSLHMKKAISTVNDHTPRVHIPFAP